jgi:iron-sulfur cluster repair protein YtfE (RIC family)
MAAPTDVRFPAAGASPTETAKSPQIQIPASIRAEHEAIHSALVEATQAPGRVGVAAKELAAVLHPHFVREEQIALPPLGLLAPLAARDPLPETVLSAALAMTDTLRSELPRMLDEHKRIRAAVEKLRQAAQAENAAKFERLAEELALHARTEEEVLYPAAVLVGDIIRARRQGK